MRSRYTAYTRGNGACLLETWHPQTRPASLDLGQPVRGIGLKIVATEAGGPEEDHGTVEFLAHHETGGRARKRHERSRFQRCDGRWRDVDGDLEPDGVVAPHYGGTGR